MSATRTLPIAPFDLPNASPAEYEALHRFTTRLRLEMMPDDPPTPLDVAVRTWRTRTPLMTTTVWLARGEDGEVVARAQVSYPNTDENAHAARFSIQVLPERRRQGLGRRLLGPITEATRAAGRTLMISETSGRILAGAAFMQALGATRGLEAHTNQLRLAEVDRDLLRQWQDTALPGARDFEIGFWDGPCPEGDLEAVAELTQVMNSAPHDALDLEDIRFTPEHLRQVEQALEARRIERWTLYARETPTARLVGFTEVFWSPHAPDVLTQGNTGVFPDYRRRGLGRRLKAAMLERVLRERPGVKFVRSGNADSNEAMLSINLDLGFMPYTSLIVWQVERERVEEYLRA